MPTKLSVSIKIAFWIAVLVQLFYITSILYIGFVARTADPIHAFILGIPLIALILVKRHTA